MKNMYEIDINSTYEAIRGVLKVLISCNARIMSRVYSKHCHWTAEISKVKTMQWQSSKKVVESLR